MSSPCALQQIGRLKVAILLNLLQLAFLTQPEPLDDCLYYIFNRAFDCCAPNKSLWHRSPCCSLRWQPNESLWLAASGINHMLRRYMVPQSSYCIHLTPVSVGNLSRAFGWPSRQQMSIEQRYATKLLPRSPHSSL
eukprot:1138065-Pelagomonas_calceolata.AAC.3